MKQNLVDSITKAGDETPSGNTSTMMGLLAYCVEQYENECGLLPQSAYLMKYVRTCMKNDVARKGVDTVGYTQLIKYVNLWSRKVNFK